MQEEILRITWDFERMNDHDFASIWNQNVTSGDLNSGSRGEEKSLQN